jgi:putative membrane protein
MRFILLLLASASAFTAPQFGVSKISSRTELGYTTKSPPPIPLPTKITYGEDSRRYRRTVYTHDDWVKHRSPDRFARNILTTTSSGIYKNVASEVWVGVIIATSVFLWNMATGGYPDLEGIQHEAVIQNQFLPPLTLSLTPFTISAPFLGLLLGKWSSALSCFS